MGVCSGQPLGEGHPVYGRPRWATPLCLAPCHEPCFCVAACCCPCCVAFYLRKWTIVDAGGTLANKYNCCQEYVCTKVGHELDEIVADRCSKACASCCEAWCLTCCAAMGTRKFVAESHLLRPDPCDNRILRMNACCQETCCFCISQAEDNGHGSAAPDAAPFGRQDSQTIQRDTNLNFCGYCLHCCIVPCMQVQAFAQLRDHKRKGRELEAAAHGSEEAAGGKGVPEFRSREAVTVQPSADDALWGGPPPPPPPPPRRKAPPPAAPIVRQPTPQRMETDKPRGRAGRGPADAAASRPAPSGGVCCGCCGGKGPIESATAEPRLAPTSLQSPKTSHPRGTPKRFQNRVSPLVTDRRSHLLRMAGDFGDDEPSPVHLGTLQQQHAYESRMENRQQWIESERLRRLLEYEQGADLRRAQLQRMWTGELPDVDAPERRRAAIHTMWTGQSLPARQVPPAGNGDDLSRDRPWSFPARDHPGQVQRPYQPPAWQGGQLIQARHPVEALTHPSQRHTLGRVERRRTRLYDQALAAASQGHRSSAPVELGAGGRTAPRFNSTAHHTLGHIGAGRSVRRNSQPGWQRDAPEADNFAPHTSAPHTALLHRLASSSSEDEAAADGVAGGSGTPIDEQEEYEMAKLRQKAMERGQNLLTGKSTPRLSSTSKSISMLSEEDARSEASSASGTWRTRAGTRAARGETPRSERRSRASPASTARRPQQQRPVSRLEQRGKAAVREAEEAPLRSVSPTLSRRSVRISDTVKSSPPRDGLKQPSPVPSPAPRRSSLKRPGSGKSAAGTTTTRRLTPVRHSSPLSSPNK